MSIEITPPPGGLSPGTDTLRIGSGVAVLIRAQEITASAVRATIDRDLQALGLLLDSIV